MRDFDLLSAVQPAGGWYAVIGIKDGGDVRQRLVATRAEFDQVAQAYMDASRNVFFGVAKFKTEEGRGKDNVGKLQAFWLDIDCGPTKAVVNEKTGRPGGYATQEEALAALRSFCKTVGLPKPIIVNSGRGLHVYWPLTDALSREQWEPIAARLREVCTTQNLYVDPAVFEVSRVLRVPGTLNFKDDPPSPVTVLTTGTPIASDVLVTLLGVKVRSEPPKRELTELGKSLLPDLQWKFSKIMRRSANGTGCQQLLDCYTNQATLEEPRWRGALSIAKFCVDRDLAVFKLSKDYPGYDPVATEAKVKGILGPHTCAVIEANNPGGCTGCPHQGKIKSPIVLGKDVQEACADELLEQILLADPTPSYTAPSYPEPYFRGKSGGVWRRGGSDEEEPILVWSEDMYVAKRLEDPGVGEVVMIRIHTHNDGIKEFVASGKLLANSDELKGLLASKGVLGGAKQFAMILDYFYKSFQEHRVAAKAEQMRLQFGWADNDSKFILGDREITKDGVFHSPPSTLTADTATFLTSKGSLEEWKKVMDLYGRPGMEPHAFAAATAFGAPLLKFLGQTGGIINVIHPTSGTGKTTILRMCNSVWGHPSNLSLIKDDTHNAKIMRFGVMNNLPVTIDEITNSKPEEFSDLIYNITQGRGKDRVKQSANELRKNFTRWQLMALTSSNASFYEKMSSYKSTPDGELMRLLEYPIENTNVFEVEFAKHMFDHVLMENYGHAGPIYAQYLVSNYEECRELTLSVQRMLDAQVGATQRERIWSAQAAANLAGAHIADKLNLVSWDKKALFAFAVNLITTSRTEAPLPVTNTVAVIGDYLNRHINNILVVNEGVDRRSQMPSLPMMEPRGELLARYEPDTKKLFIPVGALRQDCVKFQVNFRDLVKKLTDDGIVVGTEVKRVSKGMKITSPGVRCLVLDAATPDFIDVDNLVVTEELAIGSGAG
jgi:uncharacterized protein (DUF927 family)